MARKTPSRARLLGGQRQQVLPLVRHRPRGRDVLGPAGENIRQRRFPRAVRPHDRVYFAHADVQREPFENFLAVDSGVQVFDIEHFS